jgi:uncharacterized membrane protein
MLSLATLAHVHLLLNHFPTVGFAVGLGLFVVALFAKSDDMKRASLVIFVGIALIIIPAFMSGKAAEQAIAEGQGVSAELMTMHQDYAVLASVLMMITGFLSWLGLWQHRRAGRMDGWIIPAVLVLSLLTFGQMSLTANIGGEIRHPEIVSQPTVAATPWLNAAAIAGFINTTNWAWPATEALHFIGLVLILGVVLIINLRLLGVMKGVPFAAVHRLLPWAVLGLGVNLATGLVFFVTVPGQYTQNVALQWKMIVMLIAMVDLFYLTVFDETWTVRSGNDAPMRAKVIAGITIFLWIGVVWFGRMMPFIGGSF